MMLKWNAFDDYVNQLMKEEHIVGVSVAIAQNGTTIYSNGYGYANIDKKEPVTPETIFGTASITKSFTAYAILQLEREGKLSIKDPVIKHLPDFKLRGVRDLQSIQIHHLLSHTTGLPPMKRREELNNLNAHIDYLANESYELLGNPGEYFSYCNDTFLLLGAIIERITGKLFRRYITEHILSPLNMNRSTMSLEEVSKFNNVSTPYSFNRKSDSYVKEEWPTLGNYEVGGGIRSNVIDLVSYGQIYLDGSLKKMWTPVVRSGRNSFYGYGLKVTPDYMGYTLVEHGGGQPGVSSHFGFVPEEELVVAVLANVGGVPAEKIWLAAVNTALVLPIDNKRSVEPHYDASLDELNVFIGNYSSAEGGMLTISKEQPGEQIIAIIGDEEYGLRASDNETLVIERLELPLKFFFRDEINPWAVLFGSRMLLRQ